MTDEKKINGKKVFSIRKDVLIEDLEKPFVPNKELLEAAETLLEKVKSGVIDHFVIVTSGTSNGMVESYSAWFGHTDVPEFTYCELENVKDDYRLFYIRPVTYEEE